MSDPRQDAPTVSGDATWWDRSWAVSERWMPYVLLSASTVTALVAPQRPDGTAGTLALVAVAVIWVAVGHTAAPQRRRAHAASHLVYLAGLLALATLLMSRELVFFLFTITGFIHAAGLRPFPLVFVGTGSTSLAILYFTWGGWPTSTESAIAFVSVLMVQTFLIGFGVAGGEKLAELSEERRTTLAALEATLAENEALQAQIVQRARAAGVGEERQRMAREIHDTLAQGLTGVITQLEAADQSEHDPVARRRHLADAVQLARRSLTEARRSVHALAPGPLEHGRLPAAIEQQVRGWSHLHATAAEVSVAGGALVLPTETEVALLRVVQEALTNVGKHADASRVGVTLSLLDDQVLLDVRDDGRGFDPDAAARGSSFGLIAMRQRIAALGGTLTIESQPGAGTALSASVPLAVRQPADA